MQGSARSFHCAIGTGPRALLLGNSGYSGFLSGDLVYAKARGNLSAEAYQKEFDHNFASVLARFQSGVPAPAPAAAFFINTGIVVALPWVAYVALPQTWGYYTMVFRTELCLASCSGSVKVAACVAEMNFAITPDVFTNNGFNAVVGYIHIGPNEAYPCGAVIRYSSKNISSLDLPPLQGGSGEFIFGRQNTYLCDAWTEGLECELKGRLTLVRTQYAYYINDDDLPDPNAAPSRYEFANHYVLHLEPPALAACPAPTPALDVCEATIDYLGAADAGPPPPCAPTPQ